MAAAFAWVRFKSASNRYLTALGGGGGAVNAGGAADTHSRFIMVNRRGGELRSGYEINLLSASGHWVCAEDGGSSIVNANRFQALSWEEFVIVNAATPSGHGVLADGASVALMASDGSFLRADSVAPGSLIADGTSVTTSHTFTLEVLPGFDAETPSSGAEPAWPLDYFTWALRKYVKNHQIPAATFAVVKDGAPVFLRGYGYLDEARTRLTIPSTMMLIASIDKHVTSVAIETWMRQSGGLIRKRTKFFPFLRSLGVQPHGGHADPRADKITFQHLLSGTSGLSQDRPASLRTPEEQAGWVMAHGVVSDPGGAFVYPNLENELLRFAIYKHKGGREGFLRFLKDEVIGPLGSPDLDLLADDPAYLNPREPWYKGAAHTYPNRALLLTASAEALGRLFSKFRQSDGRPIGKNVPKINAILILSVPTRPGVQLRTRVGVNCGGPAYTAGGATWDADSSFAPENSWTGAVNTPIDNTSDDPLYQTDRAGVLKYKFRVRNGKYTVTLKFAETYYSNVGDRLFSVAINDDTVLVDFDIVREAGGPNRAIDRTFSVTAEDGAGIEITAVPSWGSEEWWGVFAGTTAMVQQVFDRRIVNVALFNSGDAVGGIGELLAAVTLIGTPWP